MTAEDYHIKTGENRPKISSTSGKTIAFIIQSIKNSCIPFKKVSNQPDLIKPLNENKLTQIFVEQIEVQIRKKSGIGVKNQYSDLFYGTKGIPDFYFHVIEEGATHEPLFVVESKRLPSQTFEKEYVIVKNKNGGIERFKIEKHGKGLNQCGILGFIEKGNPDYWLETINKWIEELSSSNNKWNNDEKLYKVDISEGYSYLKSTSSRKISSNILLHHFWL